MKVDELITIDQKGLRAKLEQRLANPSEYIDRPLLIWRSDFRDGVTERVVHNTFHDYNRERPREPHKWFAATLLGDDTQVSHDFLQKNIIKPGKESLVGLYVLEPMLIYADYKRNPGLLNKFHDVINHRHWGDIRMLPDVPSVAFMSIDEDWFETPDAYPAAEQYLFDPDFEQWAGTWPAKNDMLVDFLRGGGDKAGIAYRWYNYFNNQKGEEHRGCDYPSFWMAGLVKLKAEKKWKRLEKFSDIDSEDFKLAFPTGISADLIEGFRKYLLKHNG